MTNNEFKPWAIIAIATNHPPQLIGSHHTRAEAEHQLIWLQRKLIQFQFRIIQNRF